MFFLFLFVVDPFVFVFCRLTSGLEGMTLYIQKDINGIFRFDEELLSHDTDKRSKFSGISNVSSLLFFRFPFSIIIKLTSYCGRS